MAGRPRSRRARERAAAQLPIPKYFMVRGILRERFREYRHGSRLPSEITLAREFRVSRVTLQRALAGLIQDGIILRRQGKGTYYVGREPEKGAQRLSGALESLMTYEEGGRARITDKAKWVQPPTEIARQLRLRSDDGVVVIKRVASARGEPLAYIVNYLPYEFGVKIYDDDEELEQFPMISLLREKYGVPLTRAEQTIEAVLADAEVAGQLRIPIGSAVLRADRLYFAAGNRAVQATRSWYRADRYKYTVTLRGWKQRRWRPAPTGPARRPRGQRS